MADAAITAATVAGNTRGMRSVVWVSSEIGYCINIGAGTDLDYVKTTNGGKTWGAAVDIFTGTVSAYDVWYDQWTPGDTGRIIHIWYIEDGSDDVAYVALNTTNDVQTADVDVVALGSTVPARGVFISGTKSRGGKLYCAFDIDAGAEKGMYRSLDNGVTWSAMTDPIEATIDQCKLFPANAADPNDIWLLYQDADADELTVKTYDDSANSFSESSALAVVIETTDAVGQYGFDGSIRHQDGHLIIAYCNDYDNLSDSELNAVDWDGTSLTPLTNLISNSEDFYYPNVYLNQDQPDYIYVAYTGLSDGSEDLESGVGIYYALSKDRGLTWTIDIPYSTSVTDYRQTWTPLNGERFSIAYWDISGTDLMGNFDASKDFGFTKMNNYMAPRATGQNNTGIISVNRGNG